MTRARVHGGKVTVEVDAEIDVEDVLRDVTEEQLRKECAERKIIVTPQVLEKHEVFRDTLNDIRIAFAERDGIHLEVLLMRVQEFAGVPRLCIPKGLKTGATA